MITPSTSINFDEECKMICVEDNTDFSAIEGVVKVEVVITQKGIATKELSRCPFVNFDKPLKFKAPDGCYCVEIIYTIDGVEDTRVVQELVITAALDQCMEDTLNAYLTMCCTECSETNSYFEEYIKLKTVKSALASATKKQASCLLTGIEVLVNKNTGCHQRCSQC